ncbi:hypothetical protein KY284_028748 [Solanum tuberosum]|nr:hypothetical protein KY284_028748 [Solanum tuberosum]
MPGTLALGTSKIILSTLLSFGIDPSSSLRCKGNVREGERRGARMGGMKAISGGMGLSHEDAKPRDESIPN